VENFPDTGDLILLALKTCLQTCITAFSIEVGGSDMLPSLQYVNMSDLNLSSNIKAQPECALVFVIARASEYITNVPT